MVRYKGIPKVRRLYVDDEGRQIPLRKDLNSSRYFMVASSGTLSAAGDLTVTGTHFNTDSIVTASYNKSSAVANALAIEVANGSATFKGDTEEKFYYVSFNPSVI